MLVTVLFYAVRQRCWWRRRSAIIVSRNPVHSALSLVLCFVTSAAIWLLIEAEFLAVVLVLVYVGAVMVLFLFVVMMLDINIEEMRRGFTRLRVARLDHRRCASSSRSLASSRRRAMGLDVTKGVAAAAARTTATPRELGSVLYTKYAYPFELAAVLLLVAIVAAIALTMRKRPGHKVQDQRGPVRRAGAKDRVRIVKMEVGEEAMITLGPSAHAVRHPVRALGGRHLPESQERHPAAHVRGAAAARRELQFRGVLALPRGHQRAGVRVLRADGGGGRVGHRPRHPRRAVPRTPQHQRRRPEHAEGLMRA